MKKALQMIKPQNSALVINKSGNILMKYAKVHNCDFADERNVESGKEFKVCDFEGIQLDTMICYDREYPESARILMLKGAGVILIPNDSGSIKDRLCMGNYDLKRKQLVSALMFIF